jgi:hypothetical protein
VLSGILEPDNAIKGFEILSTDLDEDYQEIIDYFVGTYIGEFVFLLQLIFR